MLGHWDFSTRCVQMKTMHSAVLFMASNNNLPNPTLPAFMIPGRDLGKAVNHPMPGLDDSGYGQRIASCLEQKSTVSSFAVALKPERDLFLPSGLDFDDAPSTFETFVNIEKYRRNQRGND